MSKRQNYRNNGFKKLLTLVASFASKMYNGMFHRNHKNNGKAGGHLDRHYVGHGHWHNTFKDRDSATYKHKAAIEKKAKRKQRQNSQRINRKRMAGVCSWK